LQVILRPPAGAGIEREPITAANLGSFLAPADEVVRLQAAFRARGFEVGPLVGVSFSVSGPPGRIRELLGRPPRPGLEVSGDLLPGDLRPWVHALVVPAPPDFGPTGSGV
jgi:hypothetical protein